MGFASIIALDLGKFKSVAAVMDAAARRHGGLSRGLRLQVRTSKPRRAFPRADRTAKTSATIAPTKLKAVNARQRWKLR